ncbi:MAG: PAS domain-containing protein [Planctomycetota bacterium]
MDYRQSDAAERTFPGLASEVAGNPHLLIDILDTIYDRVFIKDADGRLVFGNRAFLRTFGLTADQVVGRELREFLPASMIESCQAAEASVLRKGESTCLETNWIDPRSGQQRWSETHKAPLRDADGNVIGVVGVSRDITSHRQTEEELSRQKTLLELIVETVPDWIDVKDRERRVVLGNRAFYEQQGLDPEQTVGTDPTGDLPDETRTIAIASDTSVLETGATAIGEMTLPGPNGEDIPIEFRKLPLIVDGEITGLVAVSRDLTEWKQSEEQSKRNEALLLHASRLSSLGELSAGIAHEVNQPLFTILNYAKAIENTLNANELVDIDSIRNWVSQIRSEAERGGQITRRLKSFAKPAESNRSAVDANRLVLESMEFVKIEARDSGVTLETDLADNLPVMDLDRIQMQQVLINLIKNGIEACEASQSQEPRLLVTTQSSSDTLDVIVADNGQGLNVSDGVNILEPFQTTKHEGVGLGLAISNTIVQSHQGEITYQTNQWGGATFCVSLPVTIRSDTSQ